MLQIIKRHQYLRGCQALRFQQLRPFMRQRDLACSGGRLRVLYAASSALGQFQPPRAQSDRARRDNDRSEEHTSELQSLMRTSYAVFCLKKKITTQQVTNLG